MARVDAEKGTKPRPLSPHLQVYRPMINMIMSIVHRITGAALYFGTLLLAVWLVAAASGPELYNEVNAWFGSVLGRIILFGYTWALLHHMFGGLRHFVWDTGRALDPESADWLCWVSLIASVLTTVVIWFAAGAVI